MEPVIIPAPASKSLSHRFLMAAALAAGESELSHVLESDDTARTRDIFTALGARFTRTGAGAFTVRGIDGKVRSCGQGAGEAVQGRETADGEPLSCFVGESGTTCRLVTAILAAGQGRFRIHGAGRMHDRPLGELTEALVALGAGVAFEGKPGCPPLVLTARGLSSAGLPGGMADMGCDESSQYLSGLLLAAPLGEGLLVRLGGEKVVSWPYVSLTLDTLERFGIPFAVEMPEDGNASDAAQAAAKAPGQWRAMDWRSLTEARPGRVRFRVEPGAYRAGRYAVEGDWSGASYFLAAGAIGPRAVRMEGLRADSLQGDAALLGILERMGARVEREKAAVTVFPSRLRGVTVDMGHCPDLVPTVAALAAHAEGPTKVTNVAHLKIKESDRLRAPAEELAKAGCRVDLTGDSMTVIPSGVPLAAPQGGFSAHGDHRMAMSVALLGLPGRGAGFEVVLDDPGCVAKSFPHFWELWARVRA